VKGDGRSYRGKRPRTPFRLTAGESEKALHRSVAEMLDWLLMLPAFYTTFPAGWGELPTTTAVRLHRSGMKAGMPDILVFDVGRVIGIELKITGVTPSNVQRAMHAKLQAVGVTVYICRNLEDVVGVLRSEGVPMRKHWMQGATHGTATSNPSSESGGSAQPAQGAGA
jgi:hypothetical protein